MFKMRSFLVAAALFGIVLAGPAPKTLPLQDDEDDGENMKYFLVETSPGVFEVEDLVNAEIDTRASEDNLVYHFFSQKDPLIGIDVKKSSIDSLGNTLYSSQRDTMFIIHGWKSNNESQLNYHVKEAILTKHDINVFVVDWSPIAGKNYVSAKNAVVKVGQYVADFIKSLEENFGLSRSQVTLVGFSLGAQIAGNAGAALNGEVDHIVGLDPAGPLFSEKKIDERLDPTDGKYVHVIHTNGGMLGFKTASGHSDYYPNGGSVQPGCGLDIGGGCAHERSYAYYSEAILASDNGFVAYQCSSYTRFKLGVCKKNDEAEMGGYTINKGASGVYYLDTNSKSPYAKK